MKKKMFMRFWLLCCLGMALALAGCDSQNSPQTGQSDDSVADRVQALYYFDGVISRDGKVLFAGKENTDYLFLNDRQGRQRYILETETTYDPERLSKYDEPLQTACTYRIYDLQGGLQKEINVQAEGYSGDVVRYAFAPDGDLNKFRVVVNQIRQNGTFQILDVDGKVLVEEQVATPEGLNNIEDCYSWLELTESIMQMHTSIYDDEYNSLDTTYFYDMSGQPLQLAQNYNYVYELYDDFSSIPSGYYRGYYENEQGQSLTDLLDKDGNVLVSGINEINRYSDGLFVVVRGFERGLIDAQGNWLYKETVFNELED